MASAVGGGSGGGLRLIPPEGLAYKRDFKMPRHVALSEYRMDLHVFVIKFANFHFAHPEERCSNVHVSEQFRIEGFHSVFILSPDYDSDDAWIILKRQAERDAQYLKKDLFVQYWDSNRENSPLCFKARLTDVPNASSDVHAVLRHTTFSNADYDLYKLPEEIVDVVVDSPGRELAVMIQMQRQRGMGRYPAEESSMFRPDNAFCDMKVRIRDPENYETGVTLIGVNQNVLASSSPYFRERLLRLRELANQGLASKQQQPIIDMTALNSVALRRLLEYFYSGRLTPVYMNYDESIEFYKICDELRVDELKRPLLDRIAFLLQDGEHIFEAYAFAEKLDIQPMKMLVRTLVHKYSKKLFNSGEWEEFKTARPDLVASLLQAITLADGVKPVSKAVMRKIPQEDDDEEALRA